VPEDTGTGGWFRLSNRLIDEGHAARMGLSAWGVLTMIARHADIDGVADPSVRTLMSETGTASQTVIEAIRVLETGGYVRCDRRNRARTRYTIPIGWRGMLHEQSVLPTRTDGQSVLPTRTDGESVLPTRTDDGETVLATRTDGHVSAPCPPPVPPPCTPVRVPPISPKGDSCDLNQIEEGVPSEQQSLLGEAEQEAQTKPARKKSPDTISDRAELDSYVAHLITRHQTDDHHWGPVHVEIAQLFWAYEAGNRRTGSLRRRDIAQHMRMLIKGHTDPEVITLAMAMYVNAKTTGGPQMIGSSNPTTGSIGKIIRPRLETRGGPNQYEWWLSEAEKLTGTSPDGVNRTSWRDGQPAHRPAPQGARRTTTYHEVEGV